MTLNGGIIQSLLFNNKMWDVVDAANWCLNHGHKVIKIDDTVFSYRFRQVSPLTLKRKGYTEYKTVKANYGIEFVMAYKPNVEHDVLNIFPQISTC